MGEVQSEYHSDCHRHHRIGWFVVRHSGGEAVSVSEFFGYMKALLDTFGISPVIATTVTAMMLIAAVSFLINTIRRG